MTPLFLVAFSVLFAAFVVFNSRRHNLRFAAREKLNDARNALSEARADLSDLQDNQADYHPWHFEVSLKQANLLVRQRETEVYEALHHLASTPRSVAPFLATRLIN